MTIAANQKGDQMEDHTDKNNPLPSASNPSTTNRPGPSATGGDATNWDADLERRISERAYELYQQRGGNDGDAFSDWLQAEFEIRSGSQGMDESGAEIAEENEPAQFGASAGGL
jgi:hypothetical protein